MDDTHSAHCCLQSVFSIIILDDIERLLEYVAIGPRFSNSILQTLLVLLKKQPPKGRKLLVIGTTSVAAVMEDMEVTTTFNVVLHVPKLKEMEITAVLKAIKAFAPDEVRPPSPTPLPAPPSLMLVAPAQEVLDPKCARVLQCCL